MGNEEAWIQARRREPSGPGTYFARTLCRAMFSGMGLKMSEIPSNDSGFEVLDRDTSTSTFDDILSPISSTYMEGKCKAGVWPGGPGGCCATPKAATLPRLLLAAKPAKSCQRTIGPPPAATLPAVRAAPPRLRRSVRPSALPWRRRQPPSARQAGSSRRRALCTFGADNFCATLLVCKSVPLLRQRPCRGRLRQTGREMVPQKAKSQARCAWLRNVRANQEVVSPLISVICARLVNLRLPLPAYMISQTKAKVKHNRKRAAQCAALFV